MRIPFFQFRKRNLYNYSLEYKMGDRRPGPSGEDESEDLGVQALKDWNRNQTRYFINNESLKSILARLENPLKSAILNEDGSFRGVEGLREFFHSFLFNRVQDDVSKAILEVKALNHFHQTGLPHALNFQLQCLLSEYEFALCNPDYSVYFYPLKNGVLIHEKNVYDQIMDLEIPNRLIKADPYNEYIAKAECRVQLLAEVLDKNHQWGIRLNDLTLHIPHNNPDVIAAFDRRNCLEKVKDFFKSIFGMNGMPNSEQPPSNLLPRLSL